MYITKVILLFGLVTPSVSQLSPARLQQCAADLACSMNYSAIFQTQLDNATHFMDLQVSILRHQLDSKLQPLETKVNTMDYNTTSQLNTVFDHLRRVENEVVYDREYLGNLTRGLYILNDEYHKESIVRYQDVHKLVLELTQTKTSLSQLQDAVNQLLTKNNMQTVQVLPTATAAPNGQTCTAKDQEISVLQANLTYYQNAYTTSNKAADNLRQLQAFLQNQVYGLKQNITSLERTSALKDRLILQLQQQLKLPTSSRSIGSSMLFTYYYCHFEGSFEKVVKHSEQDHSSQILKVRRGEINDQTGWRRFHQGRDLSFLRPKYLTEIKQICRRPLGMQDNTIPDSAITSSESQPGYEPANARLDNGQGWYTTEKQNTSDYLQIDLGDLFYVTKIATQGAPCCDVMVTNYTLQYSKDGISWKEYQNDCHKRYFSGNTDAISLVYQTLDPPITARFVRYNIVDFKRDGVSNYVGMRTELYGCSAK